MQPYGPTMLRAGVGTVFVAHGAQKLFGVWGGGGPSGTATLFNALGLSPAYPLALFVGALELAGGLMLLAGFLTWVVTLALAVHMTAAVWFAHLRHGFFLNWANHPGQGHGYEFHFLVIAALVALMLTGPGAASVDVRRARYAESAAAGRARLRAGHV